MLHITMLLITITCLSATLKAFSFTAILYSHLNMAHHPQFKPYTKEPTHQQIIQLAISQFRIWFLAILPLSIFSIIISTYIWYNLAHNSPLDQIFTTSAAIFLATTTLFIYKSNILPPWLQHWNQLLTSIRKEIELEHLLTQLQSVKSQLQQHLDGTNTLTETKLTELKLHSSILHSITKQYE